MTLPYRSGLLAIFKFQFIGLYRYGTWFICEQSPASFLQISRLTFLLTDVKIAPEKMRAWWNWQTRMI